MYLCAVLCWEVVDGGELREGRNRTYHGTSTGNIPVTGTTGAQDGFRAPFRLLREMSAKDRYRRACLQWALETEIPTDLNSKNLHKY